MIPTFSRSSSLFPGLAAVQRSLELIHYNGKADSWQLPPEMGKEAVVAASLGHRLAIAVGIRPEHNSGVVIVFAQHAQIETDIFFKAFLLQASVDVLQAGKSLKRFRVVRKRSGLLKGLRRAGKSSHFQEGLPQLRGKLIVCKQLLRREPVLVGDQTAQALFRFAPDACFLQKCLEKIHLPHAYLKFFQACRLQGFHEHRQKLHVRRDAFLPHELRAQLRRLLEAALIFVVVDKSISHIAETNRRLVMEIFRHGTGDGRRHIRTQRQRIAFLVEKFIKLPGGDGSHFPGKYIEELKGGRLNALVAALREDTVEKLLQLKLLHKLAAVNVPHTLRRM